MVQATEADVPCNRGEHWLLLILHTDSEQSSQKNFRNSSLPVRSIIIELSSSGEGGDELRITTQFDTLRYTAGHQL